MSASDVRNTAVPGTRCGPRARRISDSSISLTLHWGARDEVFLGRIDGGDFSAVAYPPYLDTCCDATEERISGLFSEDFGSFEATVTTIWGLPEVGRSETRWRASRVD